MRKYKFVLMLFLAFLLTGGLVGCQKDYEAPDALEALTEADVFVASETYQNYLKAIRKDGKKMDNILSKLTEEDRNEYYRLVNLNPENESEIEEITQAISILLNFNFKERLLKISTLRSDTFKDVDFSFLELLQAQQKYNLKRSAIPRTRSNDEKWLDCRLRCDESYAASSWKCYPGGIGGAGADWACFQALEAERQECYKGC